MIQKEVAERIVAASNNKKYGRISIMMQTFFNVKINPNSYNLDNLFENVS